MAKKMTKFGKSVPAQFRKEGVWTPQLGMYLIWFQYLQISPSYDLARRYRSGDFNDHHRTMIPTDFDMVLKVYDDLGDVLRPSFVDWWQDRGIDNFGYHGSKPTVRQIATLERSRNAETRFRDETSAYLDGKWLDEGRQNTLIVAIPTNLTKTQILKKVGQIVDAVDVDQKRLRTAAPAYKLHGKKHDESSLFRYMEVLKCRAYNPNLPLWKIGMMTNLSQTYSAGLAAKSDAAKTDLVDEKLALKILTSRAFLRGRLIAENAARGCFPSYAHSPDALKFDAARVRKLIFQRESYQRAHSI